MQSNVRDATMRDVRIISRGCHFTRSTDLEMKEKRVYVTYLSFNDLK